MTDSTERERWRRIEEVFERVRALPAAEAEAQLTAICGDDVELAQEVRALLRAFAQDDRLEPPSGEKFAGWFAPSADAMLGRRLGEFLLERRIAAGGMGVVYAARQREPARTVAVKLLRGVLHGPHERARFQHEAALLGALQHPNVAQIFAAGTHHGEDGEEIPYLAMEFVEGARSLVDAARERERRKRIELFLQALAGIRHAHQRGVVHRDLKPSNLLVDAHGLVKVIDFGVARGLLGDVARETLTSAGQLLGTLAYMSPEQIEHPERADTRADVHALGVILFELLVDRRPHDLEDLSLVEAADRVRTWPPPPPSRFDPTVDRDLDAIVAMALARDAEERYATVDDLAEDLRRWLAAEPVSARRATAWRALRLFARRHRRAVAAAAFVFVASIAGTVVSLRFAFDAERARVSAGEREREAREAAARAERSLAELLDVTQWTLGALYESLHAVPGGRAARTYLVDTLSTVLANLEVPAHHDRRRTALATAARRSAELALEGEPPDRERARAALDRAIALLEPVAEEGSSLFARDSLAAVLAERGRIAEPGEAEAFLLRSLELYASMRDAPSSVRHNHALALEFAIEIVTDGEEALAEHRLAVLRQTLRAYGAQRDVPPLSLWRRLSRAHGELAELRAAGGEWGRALRHAWLAVEIDELVRGMAEDGAAERDLVVSLGTFARIAAAAGDPALHALVLDRQLAVGRARVARDPSDLEARSDLAATLMECARVAQDRGDVPSRDAGLCEALALARAIRTEQPADVRARGRLAAVLVVAGECWRDEARRLAPESEREDARERAGAAWREALQLLDELLHDDAPPGIQAARDEVARGLEGLARER